MRYSPLQQLTVGHCLGILWDLVRVCALLANPQRCAGPESLVEVLVHAQATHSAGLGTGVPPNCWRLNAKSLLWQWDSVPSPIQSRPPAGSSVPSPDLQPRTQSPVLPSPTSSLIVGLNTKPLPIWSGVMRSISIWLVIV